MVVLLWLVFAASAGPLNNTTKSEAKGFGYGGDGAPKNETVGSGIPAGISLDTIKSQIGHLISLITTLLLALLSQISRIIGMIASLISVLVSQVGQLIGVIVGGLITYFTTTKLEQDKLEIGDRQKRQEVLSRLAGQKLVTRQLIGSYMEACISSDYNEALLNLKKTESANFIGYKNDDLESISEELLRLAKRREDLVLECAKNNQNLFENIGLIQILFPSKPELDELITEIYRFPEFEPSHKFEVPTSITNAGGLDDWVKGSLYELRVAVKSEIDVPLNNLFNYLKNEINSVKN